MSSSELAQHRPRFGRLAKAPFAATVFLCGKCAKKMPGGAKGVRAKLKAALKGRAWGKVRVVETRCFDLCPKRRQVLASARVLDQRRLLVVEPGFDAEAALATLLGPPAGSEEIRGATIEEQGRAPDAQRVDKAALVLT